MPIFIFLIVLLKLKYETILCDVREASVSVKSVHNFYVLRRHRGDGSGLGSRSDFVARTETNIVKIYRGNVEGGVSILKGNTAVVLITVVPAAWSKSHGCINVNEQIPNLLIDRSRSIYIFGEGARVKVLK
jgi:hypothetical protein